MSQDQSAIIGIDLGTTNSVVAAFVDGQVKVLDEQGVALLPSVVGLAADGKLVVGAAARNQLAAFPDRTIASVKRRMGEAVQLKMGEHSYMPQEISAIILRRLRERAEKALGQTVTRAVITVPAFFDERQREATREAGELAGFTVERIINEPTAASLVYGANDPRQRHFIVYDLGGGTFDVSIIRMEQGVIEVLCSKGNTQLGGDDFDQLLSKTVADNFLSDHGVDLMADACTRWRLVRACEQAKCELSTHETTRIIDEFIAEAGGRPLNLDVQVTRAEYEELISPLIEQTIDCVDQALRDASISLNSIDDVLLVGGSTRTPLVQQRLRQELQREPRWAVNPDLAVALGAGTQAAMQSGKSVGPVLVDVATHTLGIEVAESPFSHHTVFAPIIHRNSPLPARYEEAFTTLDIDQPVAEIHVFQGESHSLEHNRSIGEFKLDGLNQSDDRDGKVLVRFELTLDGTLRVTAREARSNVAQSVVIQDANARLNAAARQQATHRLESLFETSNEFEGPQTFERSDAADEMSPPAALHAGPSDRINELLSKARSTRSQAVEEDAREIDQLIESIEDARNQGDLDMLAALEADLDDLLYYVVG